MIKNERQYRITRFQAGKFQAAVEHLQSATAPGAIHPKLRKAEIDGLRSQLDDLQEELREYESLKLGRRQELKWSSFDDLPLALIQARIASGLSQEELAQRLGLKPQQIQRYEATNYGGASLARVSEVVKALGLRVPEGVLLCRLPKS